MNFLFISQIKAEEGCPLEEYVGYSALNSKGDACEVYDDICSPEFQPIFKNCQKRECDPSGGVDPDTWEYLGIRCNEAHPGYAGQAWSCKGTIKYEYDSEDAACKAQSLAQFGEYCSDESVGYTACDNGQVCDVYKNSCSSVFTPIFKGCNVVPGECGVPEEDNSPSGQNEPEAQPVEICDPDKEPNPDTWERVPGDISEGDLVNIHCDKTNLGYSYQLWKCDQTAKRTYYQPDSRCSSVAARRGGENPEPEQSEPYVPGQNMGMFIPPGFSQSHPDSNPIEPTINEVTVNPDEKCRKVETGVLKCNRNSTEVHTITATTNTGSNSCFWKINEGFWDGPRSCSMVTSVADKTIIYVSSEDSKIGRSPEWKITFGSTLSDAPSCPAEIRDNSLTWGTKANPTVKGGHCGLNYGATKEAAPWCFRESSNTHPSFALDIFAANTSTNLKTILPAIERENIHWQYVPLGYDDCEGMGGLLDYQGADEEGNVYYLHTCHMDNNSFTSDAKKGGPSGTIVATKATLIKNANPHIHFTIAKQEGVSWRMLEPNADLNMCQ